MNDREPPIATENDAIDAVAEALDFLDGAIDDTHPEGDGCPICVAADEVSTKWTAFINAHLAAAAARSASSPDTAQRVHDDYCEPSRRATGDAPHTVGAPSYRCGWSAPSPDTATLDAARAVRGGADTDAIAEARMDGARTVFTVLAESIREGGRSFRATIYDERINGVYADLYLAGGMTVTNAIVDAMDEVATERDRLAKENAVLRAIFDAEQDGTAEAALSRQPEEPGLREAVTDALIATLKRDDLCDETDGEHHSDEYIAAFLMAVDTDLRGRAALAPATPEAGKENL